MLSAWLSWIFKTWFSRLRNCLALCNYESSSRLVPDEVVQEPTPLVSLPDELLLEIFGRLPAEYVVKFASLCRRWKDLISTQYFEELHRRNYCMTFDSMTILVEKMPNELGKSLRWIFGLGSRERNKLYSFDAWREKYEIDYHTETGTHKLRLGSQYRHVDEDDDDEEKHESFSAYDMSFSSCGLVVFTRGSKVEPGLTTHCIILNPITREKVKITQPIDIYRNGFTRIRGDVVGLFFHPVLKEFCLFWRQLPQISPRSPRWEDQDRNNAFKLLNLGPSLCSWRNIIAPNHLCWSRVSVPPVVLDDVLYWKVTGGSILAFDIVKEEFYLLPCPGTGQLVELNDNVNGRVLSLFEFLPRRYCSYEQLIDIWIFNKDKIPDIGSAMSWIKWHTVRLNFPSISGVLNSNDLRIIAVVDEQLLLVQWAHNGLIVHNLKLGTNQLFLTDKAKNHFYDGTFMIAHTHSFISMRNSVPEILFETST